MHPWKGVEQVVVALHLTSLYRGEEQDEDEEGHGIWPEHKGIKLESSPWQSLPSDLLFSSILVRLSFPCLLSLRCVSRSWRSRLSSSEFWHSWFCYSPNPSEPDPKVALQTISESNLATQVLTSSTTNLTQTHDIQLYSILSSAFLASRPVSHLLLYSASPQSFMPDRAALWLKQKSVLYVQSRGSVPRTPQHWFYVHENFMQMQKPYTILACEKGLLLLAVHGTDSEQFVVCNPLLRGCRVLPMPPLPFVISSARFFVDSESGDYVVILLDCQSYHSKTGKWQEIQRMLHAGEKNGLPPLLDGSMFWISQQQLSGSNDVVLSAYHPREELVTSVLTRFSCKVSFPKCGSVWKDLENLQTLAADYTWFGVWQFDDGLWKKLKKVMAVKSNVCVSELSCVRIGNLLFVKGLAINQFYVFNIEMERGAWTPPYPLFPSLCVVGYCAYQPSYFEV